MKKISLILFASVMMVSFMSCGGGKKEEQKATEIEEVKIEVKDVPAATASTSEDALKGFEGFTKKYVDVINKMKTGDTKIIQEYSTLSSKYQQQIADMERYKIEFTPAQTKRYEAAAGLITKALQSWQDKK